MGFVCLSLTIDSGDDRPRNHSPEIGSDATRHITPACSSDHHDAGDTCANLELWPAVVWDDPMIHDP